MVRRLNRPPEIPSPYKERIQGLELDLLIARLGILELMPEQVQRLLRHHGCDTHEAVSEWRRSTAEKIVELAKPRPASEMGDQGGTTPRSACPLCGGGRMNAVGIEGFAVPDGLLRHLMGLKGAYQCSVFRAAEALAHDSVDRKLPSVA